MALAADHQVIVDRDAQRLGRGPSPRASSRCRRAPASDRHWGDCATSYCQPYASIGHIVTAEMSQLRAFGMSARDMRLLRLAYDIACRMARAEVRRRPVLGNWQVSIDYLQTAMAHEQVEQLRILFLDRTPEEKYAEYEKAWRTRVGDRRFDSIIDSIVEIAGDALDRPNIAGAQALWAAARRRRAAQKD